jgi:small subunit ribosomal protein S15
MVGYYAGSPAVEPANKTKENIMDKAQKTEIIAKYQRQAGDTGSPEVQIAVLSFRINELTEHLRANKKDHSTRRGLLAMVARRRKLLTYLNKENHERFISITDELKIRRR